MFAVIRHYHFNPKDGGEIDRRPKSSSKPRVRSSFPAVAAATSLDFCG